MKLQEQVMVCGVDCHTGDENCNGYCTGRCDHPPVATFDMIVERKRQEVINAKQIYDTAMLELAKLLGADRSTRSGG